MAPQPIRSHPAKAVKRQASQSSPLVLLQGDDDFAVNARARQILQQWTEATGNADQEVIEGRVNNTGEALASIGRTREALNTLPFFGGTKIVWWRNCSFFGDDRTSSSQAVTEAVMELAQEFKRFPWDAVRLVITTAKIDKRKAFYKTLEKIGTVETFSSWSPDSRTWQTEAETLARQFLHNQQISLAEDALDALINSVGPNRSQLVRELEKLVLYVGPASREITASDVQAVVVRNKQARAFALGDALGERDLPRLLRTLDEELWGLQLDRNKSEIGLLYGLISKVRMMILVKELLREKLLSPARDYSRFKAQLESISPELLPQDRRFNPLAMNAYPLFRAMQHANNYSLEELVQAMDLLLQGNQRLIFSSIEGGLVLQQTLVQIVRGSPTIPGFPAH